MIEASKYAPKIQHAAHQESEYSSTNWRMNPSLFVPKIACKQYPAGIASLSPGWFQQGHEVCNILRCLLL